MGLSFNCPKDGRSCWVDEYLEDFLLSGGLRPESLESLESCSLTGTGRAEEARLASMLGSGNRGPGVAASGDKKNSPDIRFVFSGLT